MDSRERAHLDLDKPAWIRPHRGSFSDSMREKRLATLSNIGVVEYYCFDERLPAHCWITADRSVVWQDRAGV